VSPLLRCALLLVAFAGGAGPGCAPKAHVHERWTGATDRGPLGLGDATMRWIVGGETIETGAPFDEVLLSWDVRLDGGGSGARLEARVRSGSDWSAWMTIAGRGPTPGYEPVRDDPIARVEVDMIVCRRPCDAVAWRVLGTGRAAPDVREIWVTTTAINAGDRSGPWGVASPIEHAVPHRAQRDAGEELGGRLCSPASVAMVLASRGVDVPMLAMAERAHDAEFDLYGNWVNNTLAASELGVPMRVTRIGSWAETRAFLERGPVVISLPPFHEREITGAGYSSRSGHLIVIAGLDGRGGVIVRDPAHADDATRVYRRSQLTRLWLRENRGTAYVLGGAGG